MPATLTLAPSSATGGWWVGRKCCRQWSRSAPSQTATVLRSTVAWREQVSRLLFYKLSGQLGDSADLPTAGMSEVYRSQIIYIYIYVCGHSQMPLRLVVDNHQIEQAQFSVSSAMSPLRSRGSTRSTGATASASIG